MLGRGRQVRLNAYVLAGDPAWARESLQSYYHLVSRVVVAFDQDHRSWAGHALSVEESVRELCSADPEGKIVLLPGRFSDPDRFVLAVETEHRQAALNAASEGCDWVLQLDADEILLDPDSLVRHIEMADADGYDALDYPLRDFYQSLGRGRFLEHSGRWWTMRANYPGPVAVRADTKLDHCRQAKIPVFRVDLAERNTDPFHPPSAPVHAVIRPREAVAHMSWVRTMDEMKLKAMTSGYSSSRNWPRELASWRWRQRHPLATILTTPLRRNNLEWFRISSLDVSRETSPPTAELVGAERGESLADNPAVDVVVATNRNTPFLSEALQSLVAQTHTNWHLFVVDDGAPDSTALEAAVRRVVPSAVVVHQENAGPSAARNRGVALGAAPIVAFLDDDDVWRPSRLESLVAALREAPDAVGAHSGARIVDSEGRVIGRRAPADGSRENMLSGEVPIPFFVTLAVRRTAFERAGGFDEALRWAEDNGLILDLLLQGRIISVPQDLVDYRRHPDNATNAAWADVRAANEQMLLTKISDAVARADQEATSLLRANRQHFLARAASESIDVALSELRRQRYSSAIATGSWAARRAPYATIAATIGALKRKLTLP